MSHTHTHMHTHMHAHTRMHVYTLSTHMCSHKHTNTCMCAHKQSPTGAATCLQLDSKPLIKGKSHLKKDKASFCAAVRQLILLILEKL